jgi:CrcB protein
VSLVLAVALGGAIGATTRHLMNVWAASLSWAPAWGTLGVNIIGSTIGGVLLGLMAHVWSPSEAMRVLVFVGVLGGFTTFSAFSAEVVLYIERGQWWMATFYAAVSVVLSVGGFFAGLRAVRALVT